MAVSKAELCPSCDKVKEPKHIAIESKRLGKKCPLSSQFREMGSPNTKAENPNFGKDCLIFPSFLHKVAWLPNKFSFVFPKRTSKNRTRWTMKIPSPPSRNRLVPISLWSQLQIPDTSSIPLNTQPNCGSKERSRKRKKKFKKEPSIQISKYQCESQYSRRLNLQMGMARPSMTTEF